MKNNQTPVGQPAGAGTLYARALRILNLDTIIKQILMWLYNHNVISGSQLTHCIQRFELQGA